MSAVSEPSLRERKKSRLRTEMTRAAVELFKQQGFEATTVEQIVAKVDTSPRTFFRYFGTKEDVLFGDTPDRLRSLHERLESAADDEPPIELIKDTLTEQIDNFTIFDDARLEADCAASGSPSLRPAAATSRSSSSGRT